MNLHEQIDRISAWSPRAKVIGVLSVCAVIGLVLGLAFWSGFKLSRKWADSEYLEREKLRDVQITQLEADAKRHADNETQLAAENSLLKKQQEATAEILAQRDKAQAATQAQQFTDLANKRNQDYENIDVDNNYDSQLCGLCADAKRAGHQLSDTLCQRCKGDPQNNR